jgi:hypothetical protein
MAKQNGKLKVTEESVGPATVAAKSQTEFEGIKADTPLGEACENYVVQKNNLTAAKEKLQQMECGVIDEMKKANRRVVNLKIDGGKYTFEVTEKEEKLRCSKKRELALV